MLLMSPWVTNARCDRSGRAVSKFASAHAQASDLGIGARFNDALEVLLHGVLVLLQLALLLLELLQLDALLLKLAGHLGRVCPGPRPASPAPNKTMLNEVQRG